MNIKMQLLSGFSAILVIMVLVSANSYYQLSQTTKIEHRLLNIRQPTVIAGLNLEDGLDLSLAGLRGYLILGGDPAKAQLFKKERALGWQKIDQALNQLKGFSTNWTVQENIKRLTTMTALIKEFRIAQQEVENRSHTNANIPSHNILLTEAAPLAAQIIKAITALINQESQLKATAKRKKLLKLLADSRGSFALGMANIRAYLLSGNEQFKDEFFARWQTNQQKFDQISAMISLFSPAQTTSWQSYRNSREKFAPLPEKMFTSRASKEWNLANYYLATKAAPKSKAIKKILAKMRQSQMRLSNKDTKLLEQKVTNTEISLVIACFIAVIVGGFIAFYLSKSITKRLSSVVKRAKNIAAGDLTNKPLSIEGNDEITELTIATTEMEDNLKEMINEIKIATETLSAQSTQLQNTVTRTEDGVAAQTLETEQVATGMNEMTATIADVARNASEAADATYDADDKVGKGKEVVENNMVSIESLAASIDSAAIKINELGEDTKNVDNIIEVIRGIAEQTNLLALNAAIEAARAGEQGRGFAVVADEVRTLASRTQESTEEIRSMLDRLKVGVNEVVQVMNKGREQAIDSVDQVKFATSSFDQIAQSVNLINDMNAQIATAAEQQSSVAEEMNQNIVRINTNFAVTLTNTQETGVASVNVNDIAANLQSLMAKFKV
jgi:methyl-accepting chemotaxis protein